MAKQRLDVAMAERGLAESRQKAQAVIMAGQVYVDGRKVEKAGTPVSPEASIEVRGKTTGAETRFPPLHRQTPRWSCRTGKGSCGSCGPRSPPPLCE